jgi:putative MATE family efflux protein
MACAVFYLQRSKHVFLRLDPKSMEFDRHIFVHSVRIGLPSGVQQMAVALGMMALSRIVNGFGTTIIAAYTIMGRLESFIIMPAMNFSMAISTFVGQNLGAGKPERVRRGLKTTLGMALSVALTSTIIVLLFRRGLCSIFTSDEAVILEGMKYLAIVAAFYCVFTAQFVLTGVFRGAGDTVMPLLFTLMALWIIRIPAAWVLSRAWGTTGIWAAIPAAWSCGCLMSVVYYRIGHWRHKAVIKIPVEPAAVD